MNHGPHDICRSCETVDHCSSAGCIPLTTPSGAKACSMNPDSLPSADAWLKEAERLISRYAVAMFATNLKDWAALLKEAHTEMFAHLAAHPAAPQGAQPAEPQAWMVWWGIGHMRPAWPPHRTREEAEQAASQIKSNTEVRPLYASPADAAPVVPQEVERDAKRMDWLDARRDTLIDCYMQDGKLTYILRHPWGAPIAHGNSVRAAIDAAMNAGLTIPAKEQPHG